MSGSWIKTVDYIHSHEAVGGVTWEQGCTHFGITRAGWRQRIKEVRRVVALHPDLGYVLPRPTKENGWRYRVTNHLYEVGKADIRDGHIDDNIQLLGILRRVESDTQAAYEQVVADEPGGKRSRKAKEVSSWIGAANLLIDACEKKQLQLGRYPIV